MTDRHLKYFKAKLVKGLLAVILFLSFWTMPGYGQKTGLREYAKSRNELILTNRKVSQKSVLAYRTNFKAICFKSVRADLYKTKFEQRIQIHNTLSKNTIKQISNKFCCVESFDGFLCLKTFPMDSDESDSILFLEDNSILQLMPVI